MSIRVLRIMEYVYEDHTSMITDMSKWAVQGTINPNGVTISSTTLPLTLLPETEAEIVHYAQAMHKYTNRSSFNLKHCEARVKEENGWVTCGLSADRYCHAATPF